MPRFDGTGPDGFGPMTGRGLGRCNRWGRGCGFGYGRGFFGYRRRFGNSFTERLTPQEKIETLKADKREIEAELEALEKELE